MSKRNENVIKESLSKIKQVAGSQKQVQPETQQPDFSQYHIHFMIPCYSAMMTEACFTSFLKFALLAQKVGLQWSLDTMGNESLIPRGRNNLMAKARTNPQATHYMFIDSDIRFPENAIFQMLTENVDIISAAYPKKSLPVQYAINLKSQTKLRGNLFTVDTAATGFLMYKKEVWEKLISAHPETKYVDDIGLGYAANGQAYGDHMYNIFASDVDSQGHLLSEDWWFSRLCTELGYDIWIHGGINLSHIGAYEFKGDTSVLVNQLHDMIEPTNNGEQNG